MRAFFYKIGVMLAIASGYAAAVSCGDDSPSGNPDGGGGTGGSGGAMDASDGPTGTVGCLTPMTTPTTCPSPPVTFANVQPFFQARCVNVCHNGVTPDPNIPGATIWPLMERAHILEWCDGIRALVADCSMPPPDAGVPMTIEERKAIVEFMRCECPK
jgi:hypothetical protein